MYDDYNGRMREDEVSCTLTPNTGSSTERNGQKYVCRWGFNTEADGTARTIKRQYQQTSGANLVRRGTFGASGVAVEVKEATKSGHATARGGETVSISRSRNREQEEDGSG